MKYENQKEHKMRVTSTKDFTMNDFIRNHIENTSLDRLIVELEEIIRYRLTDDVIIESKELRTFYGSMMEHIKSHIGKKIDLDLDKENEI